MYGGTVFGQSENIAGVWASEERSANGYPLWVFELSDSDGDSGAMNVRLTEHSENHSAQYLDPVFDVVPEEGHLKFGLSKLQLSDNPKVQKVQSIGASGSPSDYFGGIESTLAKSRNPSATVTMNYFDLDVLSGGQFSGDWYWKTSTISKSPEQRDFSADMTRRFRVLAQFDSGNVSLNFRRTTLKQLHRDNMATDIRNMNAKGGKYKYMGRYATEMMYAQYSRQLKIANSLRNTGIGLEATGGTMILFMGVFHLLPDLNASSGVRAKSFLRHPIVRAGFATAAIGAGLHISGAIVKKRVYKRFLDENNSYLDMDVTPGGLSMSCNF
jgi:hypothetical protein